MRNFDWKPLSISTLPQSIISKICKQFKLSKIGSEVLLRRLVSSGLMTKGYDQSVIKKFLSGSYNDLYNPFLFSDMLKALTRILSAVKNKEKILIHGDYDVDGIMSVSLIKYMFDNMDYYNVKTLCPTRSLGYGLSKNVIKMAIRIGVNLIIACDCGSNEKEAHSLAKKNKIDVVVLDHHSFKKRPLVHSFINPEAGDYPFQHLCAAGVCFKLVQAMNSQIKTYPEQYLDLVCLATVADSVILTDENRILVKLGLKQLSKTNNTGLRDLLKVCGFFQKKISTEIIGFVIGPKINAPGRLFSPRPSLDLMLTNNENKANKLAHKLAQINKKRIELNHKIRDEAIKQVEEKYMKDRFLVISDNSWNKGIIGIVASTLVEIYHKPCAIISNGYGSVRTVPEFSLLEPLGKCSDLLDKWGGHPMAAGLKVKKKNINALRIRLNEVSSILPIDPVPYMVYDARIKMRDINMRLVEEMEKFEPFGNGNPLPQFITEDVAMARDRVTKDGQHLQMTVRKGKDMRSAIGFWMAGYKELFVDPTQKFDMLFFLERNSKGDYEQIVMKDIKEVKLNW
jgi:single-stranded-DNA-specific exonuclease